MSEESYELRQRAETAWQRGYQQGRASNALIADQAMDALKKEREGHAETNRLMTEALLMMEEREKRDEALMRQALYALETTARYQTCIPGAVDPAIKALRDRLRMA